MTNLLIGKLGSAGGYNNSVVGDPTTLKYGLGDSSGCRVLMDFYTKAILDGRGYQIRAGTVSTPLTGGVVITNSAAEYCADPIAGYTILPVAQIISIRLSTGTLHGYTTKSVATASSAGTAFVPLPLMPGGAACFTTARVQAAGNVTVTAELATTTRRHWSWANPAAGFTGALPGDQHQEWYPRCPPPIRSTTATAWCIYTQIAATTTGPDYYANFDYLEFNSAAIGTAN